MSAVTLGDVAGRAGVSIATVSNVLNRPDLVRESTRLAVERAITELGYVPNASARQLAGGGSRMLAYVIFDIGNPYFTDVARGVEQAASEAGCTVFLFDSNRSPDKQDLVLRQLAALRVRGVVLTSVDAHLPPVDALRQQGIPVVLVSQDPGELEDCCSVAVDDVAGGTLAVAHLLDLGHERVAFVGGPVDATFVAERIAGARAALVDAGRDPHDLLVLETTTQQIEDGRRAGQRLIGLAQSTRPTGVFCCNDLVALGMLQVLTEHGIAVPDDIALVGYDDIEFAAAAAVPLTSVAQPRRHLGSIAARLLLDETDDPLHEHRHVTLQPELVARASTMPRARVGRR